MRVTKEQFAALQNRRKPYSKYGAKKVSFDGIEFDSTKEARRYQDLVLMQKAGQIRELRRQVPFEVTLNGVHICKWIADFVYHENTYECPRVVEDCKGFKTDIYRLKKKLVEAKHGFKILET